MLGYSGFREVMIWVQTTDQASVKVGYFKKGEQERFTEVVKTHKSGDYIAKLYPKGLDYGHRYDYVVYINDEALSFDYPLSFQSQALWQWRSDPPAFSFAIGSCYYANEAKDDRPGKPYGGEYGIFDAIHEKAPDFMMWLGDNMYLRTPDFLSNTGIRHRYRHARSLPELQPLLGSVHHYAIWDDHDYGPNDADRSFVNKQLTEARLTITGKSQYRCHWQRWNYGTVYVARRGLFHVTTAIIGHPINQSLRVRIFLEVIKSIG